MVRPTSATLLPPGLVELVSAHAQVELAVSRLRLLRGDERSLAYGRWLLAQPDINPEAAVLLAIAYADTRRTPPNGHRDDIGLAARTAANLMDAKHFCYNPRHPHFRRVARRLGIQASDSAFNEFLGTPESVLDGP